MKNERWAEYHEAADGEVGWLRAGCGWRCTFMAYIRWTALQREHC